jgi:glycosyltransferase involved in cell wall biosynthesis
MARTPAIVLVIQKQREVFFEELPLPLAIVCAGLEYLFFTLSRIRSCNFIVISDSAKKDLAAMGISGERIQVCPPGLGLNLDPEMAVRVDERRDRVILVLSRMRRYKKIDEAVKAFALAQSAIPGYRLVIIAKPSNPYYADEVRRLIKRLGLENSVEILEHASREEKVAALKKSKVLLYLSAKEGFGMAAIEAAYFGTPVLAYNVSGLSDAVQDGKTGLLLPPGDVPAVARALSQVIHDEQLYSFFSQNGRKFAGLFNWEQTTKDFEAFLWHVLSNEAAT